MFHCKADLESEGKRKASLQEEAITEQGWGAGLGLLRPCAKGSDIRIELCLRGHGPALGELGDPPKCFLCQSDSGCTPVPQAEG